MDVVTSLTSTLIFVVSIALVIFSFKWDVRRFSRHRRAQKPELAPPESAVSRRDAGVVSVLATSVTPTHSLEGFLCQYTPAENDLHIYSRLAIFGPSIHPITVHNGGQLMLFGPCAASITVRSGGMAMVYGLVTGELVNEGGDMHVYGTVIGKIHKNGGSTSIHPVARVSPGCS